MKIKRSTKEYGGGSGKNIFESDYFSVTVWKLSNGVKTSIPVNSLFMDINFDGEHEIISDDMCLEQLDFSEVLQIINTEKEKSFEEGQESKLDEIQSCLGIKDMF